MGASAVGVEVTIYCWVNNADFLRTRSDLWLKLMQVCKDDSGLSLSLPAQDVYVNGSPV